MRKSKVYQEIFKVQAEQLHTRSEAVKDLKKQLRVDTATWALEIYERAAGLVVDTTKPLSERRSRIKAKLRGVGKVDSELIKLVVSSWTGGIIDVDFSDSVITLKFIDPVGIPENMIDVYLAVDEIKPAHLAVIYEFIYNIWANVAQLTWGELEQYTWEEVLSSNILS